jgi:hypothetical protein
MAFDIETATVGIGNGETRLLTEAEKADQLSRMVTPEGIYQLKREEITERIYDIASAQSHELSSNYSIIEAVRWTEDREAIALGNWSHFDDRAGTTMTGQQYAETRVIPKITAGNIFLDKVIAKRTDLMIALANTADVDLDSFDYTSMWDESTDYTPPPIEEVSTSRWDALMASIPLNIKLW